MGELKIHSDLKSHKLCIFGIQGSGKTEWIRRMYGTQFKKPIVFSVNEDDDWEKMPNIYVYKAKITKLEEEVKLFTKKCREWARAGKIDLIIFDEADLFFQTNWDLNEDMTDIVINHRHMGVRERGHGVAVWFATRRPQDIPTKIVEQSRHLVIFKIEGVNALKKFDEIHPDLKRIINGLSYTRHNFIYKEIGQKPILCSPLPKLEKKKSG